MYTNDHGGSCCGITHLIEFAYRPSENHFKALKEETKEITDNLIDRWNEGHCDDEENICDEWEGPYGHCIEAVLTDAQLKEWGCEMKKQGWKLVFRFLNDNSNNICNLLVKSDKEITDIPSFWN